MRRLLPVIALAGAVLGVGASIAIGGAGESDLRRDMPKPTTEVPWEAPAWAVVDENPFRWTTGIPQDTISGCPVGEGEKKCLIDWGRGRLDGSVERLDEVVIAISLRTLGDKNFFDGACHDVWHDVGERAGELYDVGLIIEHWPDMCHGGMIHGAMNARAELVGAEIFGEEVEGLCQVYDGWTEIMKNDCYHGIGHGFGSIENWDTFFTGCNRTGLTGEPYDWCAAGVMETVVERISEEGLRAAGPNPQAYETLCLRLEREKDPCWRYIIFPLLAAGETLADIATRCAALDEQDSLRCSFAIGGVAASGWEFGGDDLELCERMAEAAAAECWKGAARSVARGTERAGPGSTRADELPEGWRLSLCAIIPTRLSTWCRDMEDFELGDQTDQVAQAELSKQWRNRFGLSWPY